MTMKNKPVYNYDLEQCNKLFKLAWIIHPVVVNGATHLLVTAFSVLLYFHSKSEANSIEKGLQIC